MNTKYVRNGLIFSTIIVLFSILGFTHNSSVSVYDKMRSATVVIFNEYGYGSGVFINDNTILTAAHVLQNGGLKIRLINNIVIDVNDCYVDAYEDIGFIYVDVNEISIAKLSVVESKIGDTVYLVGAPYSSELAFTVTKGIVSNKNISIFDWKDLIQTDAEGAPGSSGCPLYNESGEIIGMCVTGPNPGGGVTLCEDINSIKNAHARYMESKKN